jgi:hypothetical protein
MLADQSREMGRIVRRLLCGFAEELSMEEWKKYIRFMRCQPLRPFLEHKYRINRGIPVNYLLFLRTARFNDDATASTLVREMDFFASLCAVL